MNEHTQLIINQRTHIDFSAIKGNPNASAELINKGDQGNSDEGDDSNISEETEGMRKINSIRNKIIDPK